VGPSAALIRPARFSGWIAATFYLGIVLALWAPFNLFSGMPYETGFVYTSEVSTWWNGFLFGADWSRIHTSTFFQVPYLVGELTGFAGSWVPYQVVYAALWWARGFLMFLIVRRLAPGHDAFAFLAGALALVHSSDFTTGWVGQMPQQAYIFWMLAAFYLLLRALDEPGRGRARVCLGGAMVCEAMSLWTYESPIVLIVFAPVLLFWLRRKTSGKLRVAWWGWYAVPAIYVAFAAARYMRAGGHTYQESVLRKNWAVGPMLGDWAFNIGASLRFWAWAGVGPSRAATEQVAVFALMAVAAMLAGAMVLAAGAPWPDARTLIGAMVAGVGMVVLSFPVYLLLDSARSLWRTQILSGIGAGLVFSAGIAFCAAWARASWLRVILMGGLGAWVCWCGSYSALEKSAGHRWNWELHKRAMAEVLAAAPRVKPGTLILYKNVPGGAEDPFAGDNTWFDMALRLAYPGTPVAGAYWHTDGTAAQGPRPLLEKDGTWILPGNPLIERGDARSVLVVEYSQQSASIADHFPDFLGVGARAAELYNPRARIEAGRVSERATRRYGVLR